MTINRTEFFGPTAVTVSEQSQDSREYARSIASMKMIQGDNQPFYVMNPGAVVEAIQEWFQCLPRISPFYSIRCNDDAVLLRLLAAHPNVGFHCITRENLDTATDLIPAGRILYGNPCWTRGSLRNASQCKVGLISFESTGDLDRVALVYPNASLILNVSVNPGVEDERAGQGCVIEEAADILRHAADLGLDVCGIAFHVGSGCRDVKLFAAAIRVASELFCIGAKYGLNMNVLDIGGGFLHSSDNRYDEFVSFADVCAAINSALDFYFAPKRFPELRIIARPGRFFARDAFALSTNIIDKRAVDLSVVTNDDFDSGYQGYVYQINEGFYGSFGCRLIAHCEPKCSPLFTESCDDFPHEHFYGSVVGPSSDEFDVAQSLCHLRQMSVGDWLIWPKMGAYSSGNRASLGDVDIPAPAVYYYCTADQWRCIERLTSLEALQRPKSISTMHLTSRRSSLALSLLGGSIDDDDCYGSLSDLSDAASCSDESVQSAEDAWMARWPFQETLFD